MGGLDKLMPITSKTFFVSCLAIAGIPPLAAFFSKDEILYKAFSVHYGSPQLAGSRAVDRGSGGGGLYVVLYVSASIT